MNTDKIYIFHGAGARFSGAAFSSVEKANTWIKKHELTGMLTAYPIDRGAYEWAIEKRYFTPKKELHHSPEFIGGFTSASMEHYHYENGFGS